MAQANREYIKSSVSMIGLLSHFERALTAANIDITPIDPRNKNKVTAAQSQGREGYRLTIFSPKENAYLFRDEDRDDKTHVVVYPAERQMFVIPEDARDLNSVELKLRNWFDGIGGVRWTSYLVK